MNKKIKDIFELIPKEAFLDKNEHSYTDNLAKHIRLGIVSETTNVFINRNNSPKGVTSYTFANKPRVMVPATKWKGAEQSNMVKLAREMDILPDGYQQNMIKNGQGLINPVSAIYGDTVTEDSSGAQLKGRVNYDWAFSHEPVGKISRRMQHNTLSEDGSIKKSEEGSTQVASSAIYNTQYVVPGVKFIRFISLENVTPEMFIFYLTNLLNTHRYGARTTITGDNMNNKLITVSWGQTEEPMSSYSVLKEIWDEGTEEINHEEMVEEKTLELYGKDNTIYGGRIEDIKDISRGLLNDMDEMKEMLEPINDWLYESLDYIE